MNRASRQTTIGRAARASRRVRLRARAGVTLIEILVVIAILGLMVGSVAFGINAVPRARLRTSAMRMASTLRFAYIHALTTGHTTRVSFRLGLGELSVQETEDAHTLDRNDPMRAGGAADVEAMAQRDAQRMMDPRPRAPRASFNPVPTRVFRPRPLEDRVVVHRIYTPHDPEPREEGNGHVYFFSGGATERVVIQLRNDRGEIYSVMLNPLTGRSEVFDRPVEPPTVEDRDQTDQQEIDAREQAAQDERPR